MIFPEGRYVYRRSRRSSWSADRLRDDIFLRQIFIS